MRRNEMQSNDAPSTLMLNMDQSRILSTKNKLEMSKVDDSTEELGSLFFQDIYK